MRRGSAALDAILSAPGGKALSLLSYFAHFPSALARTPDIAATSDFDAPDLNLEDNSSMFSSRFSATPLRHEDVSVALENESGSSSSRRASLIPTQSLVTPLFSSIRVTCLL